MNREEVDEMVDWVKTETGVRLASKFKHAFEHASRQEKNAFDVRFNEIFNSIRSVLSKVPVDCMTMAEVKDLIAEMVVNRLGAEENK